MYNVLFLCTGNSCRSIMAEALLTHFGNDKFNSYSAGSFPTGEVHSLSLSTLKSRGITTAKYRSKSWDEFVGKNIDIVITVCDSAAGETCPVFYGSPVKAHWGVPDPAKFEGTDKEISSEFNRICDILEKRIKKLIELSVEKMDKQSLQQQLHEIGKIF